MAKVLVVEGNTPEGVAAVRAAGGVAAAETYAGALRAFAPGLEIAVARPSFPGFDARALSLDGIDGVALTGSGAAFAADAPEARPHRALVERAFAAGLPVIGSCWGLQVPAVVLGGGVGAAGAGIEVPVARDIRLTPAGLDHPLHAHRGVVFDAPCIHRDEVRRPPTGARVTATNGHSAVQAMVYEQGGVRFWGMQYHPEHGPEEALRYLRRPDAAALLAGAEPLVDATAVLAADDGLGSDRMAMLTDPAVRGAELKSWLLAIGAIAVRVFDQSDLCPAAPRLRQEPAALGRDGPPPVVTVEG
ncbi:MAG: gamma-glutamyl-gamma-aminobutyrate hydrolase family protein [Paracoccaceae bacterium]